MRSYSLFATFVAGGRLHSDNNRTSTVGCCGRIAHEGLARGYIGHRFKIFSNSLLIPLCCQFCQDCFMRGTFELARGVRNCARRLESARWRVFCSRASAISSASAQENVSIKLAHYGII